MPSGSNELPLHARVLQIITAGWLAQAVSATAELGVADVLAEGPRPVAEIAEATDTHAPSLHRLLRAGCRHRTVHRTGRQGLRADRVGQHPAHRQPEQSAQLRHLDRTARRTPRLVGLADAVRTGRTAFTEVLGKSVWDYFHDHPDVLGVFDRAMTEASRQIIAPVVAAYDFGRFDTVVDAGGGRGALLAAVLASAPGTRGVLYDRPEVIAGAGAPLRDAGVDDRAELVSGDFFDSVPAGADAVILSNIIHDWDDEQSRRILVNARDALTDGGHVLLVEAVLPDRPRPTPTVSLMDLDMLVVVGGRRRTAAEFETLLADSGLKLSRIVPGGHCSVVEAVRA